MRVTCTQCHRGASVNISSPLGAFSARPPSYRSPASRDSFGVWALSGRPPPPGSLSGLPSRLPFLPTRHLHILRAQLRCTPSPFLQNLARTIYRSHLRRTFSFPFLCPLYLLLTSHKPSIFFPRQPRMKSYYVPVIGPGAKCTEVRKKL